MSLEKQVEKVEAKTCNRQTEIGTFTSKLAILSQHMQSQLRLEPCSKFVDKTPSSPPIKTHHTHTCTYKFGASLSPWLMAGSIKGSSS